MAFLDEEFSVDTLPVGNNFEPLPEGWYNATIANAPLLPTKASDGKLIAVKYIIIGPSHQGRVIFGNLNIKNPNPKAEEIGRQQLGEIMRAIGLAKVTDTDQLIGGNLGIKLSVKTGEYVGNEVKAFRALSGSTPAPVAPFKALGPSASTPAKARPPWVKK